MSTRKIIVSILCAAAVGGLTQASTLFPDLAALLAAIAAIVAGFGAVKNGADNEE